MNDINSQSYASIRISSQYDTSMNEERKYINNVKINMYFKIFLDGKMNFF